MRREKRGSTVRRTTEISPVETASTSPIRRSAAGSTTGPNSPDGCGAGAHPLAVPELGRPAGQDRVGLTWLSVDVPGPRLAGQRPHAPQQRRRRVGIDPLRVRHVDHAVVGSDVQGGPGGQQLGQQQLEAPGVAIHASDVP